MSDIDLTTLTDDPAHAPGVDPATGELWFYGAGGDNDEHPWVKVTRGGSYLGSAYTQADRDKVDLVPLRADTTPPRLGEADRLLLAADLITELPLPEDVDDDYATTIFDLAGFWRRQARHVETEESELRATAQHLAEAEWGDEWRELSRHTQERIVASTVAAYRAGAASTAGEAS